MHHKYFNLSNAKLGKAPKVRPLYFSNKPHHNASQIFQSLKCKTRQSTEGASIIL